MGPRSPGSSGGDIPWEFLLLLAVVILVGLTILALQTWRRKRAERLADRTRIERTRAAIRQQLDAVADDILNLEGPVRAAGNKEALAHYRNATVTYAAIVGEFETGDTPQELTNLATRLDTAIWQLDAAEAILDGDPLPPEPAANTATLRSQPTHRRQWPSDRNSAAGVTDLISAILEAGPRSARPSLDRRRHHSPRRHC